MVSTFQIPPRKTRYRRRPATREMSQNWMLSASEFQNG
jgi:hypothetical protein